MCFSSCFDNQNLLVKVNRQFVISGAEMIQNHFCLVSLKASVTLNLIKMHINWSKHVKPHVDYIHRRNVNISKLNSS